MSASTRTTKYRIESVTIEGFRGFTKPQTVDIGGRNLFVFGENGRGKSSIIEAIRWCLFGAPAGGDIEVRNTFYSLGECRVSLTLAGPDGPLQVIRELRPGTPRSRPTIRTSAGQTLRERDALPGLARIGHQQGAQVIFSAQQAAGRALNVERPDFTRVLCCYLRLDDVPSLLERLDQLLEEREHEATALARLLEDAEDGYRRRLDESRAKLEELVGDPPWGSGPAPTVRHTHEKLLAFARQVAPLANEEFPDDLSPASAFARSRVWLDNSVERTADSLQTQVEALSQTAEVVRSVLPEFRELSAAAQALEHSCHRLKAELAEILKNDSCARFKERLREREQALDQSERCFDLARTAEELSVEHSLTFCPACGSEYENHAALLEQFRRQLRLHRAASDAELIGELRERIAVIERLESEVGEAERSLLNKEEAIAARKGTLREALSLQDGDEELARCECAAEELFDTLRNLEAQLADAESERTRWYERAKDLAREMRYHELRDATQDLDWSLTSGLKDAREYLAAYHDLLATTRGVRSAVKKCFDEAIDRAIPFLNEMLTEVYTRLTMQRSYDKVIVERDAIQDGKLDMRVASRRRPGQTYATDVLNGQAARALQLVPYFVFSRFLPDLMELDLLLVDDPSESFDTSHVESLVKELAEAAAHAQIVVATHEQEKFRPFLDVAFPPGSLGTICVEDFTPEEGPVLAAR